MIQPWYKLYNHNVLYNQVLKKNTFSKILNCDLLEHNFTNISMFFIWHIDWAIIKCTKMKAMRFNFGLRAIFSSDANVCYSKIWPNVNLVLWPNHFSKLNSFRFGYWYFEKPFWYNHFGVGWHWKNSILQLYWML